MLFNCFISSSVVRKPEFQPLADLKKCYPALLMRPVLSKKNTTRFVVIFVSISAAGAVTFPFVLLAPDSTALARLGSTSQSWWTGWHCRRSYYEPDCSSVGSTSLFNPCAIHPTMPTGGADDREFQLLHGGCWKRWACIEILFILTTLLQHAGSKIPLVVLSKGGNRSLAVAVTSWVTSAPFDSCLKSWITHDAMVQWADRNWSLWL